MKKSVIYLILVALFPLTMFNACKDDDTLRFNPDEFGQGFLPYFALAENSASSFNPDNLSGSSVTLIVDLRAQETEELASEPDDVNSIDIVVVYDNLLTPLAAPDTGVVSSISSFPTEITVTPQQMVDALDSLSSLDDITVGAAFTFSQRINMKDGRVINGIGDENTLPVYDSEGNPLGNLTYDTYDNDLQINESGQNVYEYSVFVNCASDIGGEYVMESEGEGGWGLGTPTEWSSTVNVTLTATGGGVYQCDACMGGLMKDFYGAYGATMVAGRFILLCDNTIQGLGIFDGWNNLVQYEGTLDPASGEITLNWANPWGDHGTSVLTPAK